MKECEDKYDSTFDVIKKVDDLPHGFSPSGENRFFCSDSDYIQTQAGTHALEKVVILKRTQDTDSHNFPKK